MGAAMKPSESTDLTDDLDPANHSKCDKEPSHAINPAIE